MKREGREIDAPVQNFKASRFSTERRGETRRVIFRIKNAKKAAACWTDAGGVGDGVVVSMEEAVAGHLPDNLVVTDESVGRISWIFVQLQIQSDCYTVGIVTVSKLVAKKIKWGIDTSGIRRNLLVSVPGTNVGDRMMSV